MSTALDDTPGQTEGNLDAVWERMEAGVRRAHERPHTPATARPDDSLVAPDRRFSTALVGVAGIIVVIVMATLVAHLLHPTPAVSGSGSAPAPATHRAAPSAVDREHLETATDDAVSATTAMRTGFTVLKGIPTVATTAAIINPYVDSLQLYGTLLGATPVPSSASAPARTVSTDVREDATYLEAINGLASANLGAFIDGVFTRATALETATGALENALRPPPIGS